MDYKSAYEGVGKSEGISTFKKRLNRGNGYSLQEEKTDAERAKMPIASGQLGTIASGQLGLLLITGVADGLLGEGDTLHAVRGSENVYYEHSFEQLGKNNKRSCFTKTSREIYHCNTKKVKSKNLSRKGRRLCLYY